MKSTIFSLILFLSVLTMLVSTVHAQEFKLIQGLSLSSYSTEPDQIVSMGIPTRIYDYKIKSVTGLLLWAGIELDLSKNIAIEINALYFQKGSNIKEANESFAFNYHLNAVSIPILFKIKPLSGLPAYFLGGGELSIILTHEQNESTITEYTETFDSGLIAGGGIEIKIKNRIFCLEGRYHLGLRNITERNWPFDSIKTKAFVILWGIKM